MVQVCLERCTSSQHLSMSSPNTHSQDGTHDRPSLTDLHHGRRMKGPGCVPLTADTEHSRILKNVRMGSTREASQLPHGSTAGPAAH